MLLNESVPDARPVALGLKDTVKLALPPAAMVKGNVRPLKENSELLMEAEETVTLALLALRVPDRLALPPVTTLPKLRLPGLTPNWPAAVPVPDMEIVRFGFEPFDTTEIVPLALAADVGAKLALKVKLCPAVRVMGGFKPLMLKPVPEAVA